MSSVKIDIERMWYSKRILSLGLVLGLGCGDTGEETDSPGSDAGPDAESDSASVGDDSSTSEGSEAECEELRQVLETAIDSYRSMASLVGIAVSVSSGMCEPWTGAWGLANAATGEPLTTDHLLRAGSVTKMYTAPLVLVLAREGLLSLDDALDSWGMVVPGAAEITIRQLLNHTSGLADYQHSGAFWQDLGADPGRVWSPQELIDYAVALGPVGAPGQAHWYSNTNYILAGLIVEQATGQSYAEALRTRVLQPNQLAHTYLEGYEVWDEPTATGYLVRGMGELEDTSGDYHASQVWSAGALVSTVEDLREWISVLLGTDFLDADSQAELIDFVPAAGTSGYGLGVFVLETANVRAFGHNGAVMGFQATALHDPKTRSSIAVMHNQLVLDGSDHIAIDPTLLAVVMLEAIAAHVRVHTRE